MYVATLLHYINIHEEFFIILNQLAIGSIIITQNILVSSSRCSILAIDLYAQNLANYEALAIYVAITNIAC